MIFGCRLPVHVLGYTARFQVLQAEPFAMSEQIVTHPLIVFCIMVHLQDALPGFPEPDDVQAGVPSSKEQTSSLVWRSWSGIQAELQAIPRNNHRQHDKTTSTCDGQVPAGGDGLK